MNSFRGWEDQLIIKHYPKGGANLAASLLPSRTARAIRDRAGKLGVRPARTRWSRDEDRILRGCHPDLKKAGVLLPNRTAGAIKGRSNELQLGPRVKPWRPAQDELIHKLAPNHTDNQLADILGRTVKAIAWRRDFLGIARRGERTSAVPVVNDVFAEARARGVRVTTLTRALKCPRIRVDRKHLSASGIAKIIEVFGGQLYAEWKD